MAPSPFLAAAQSRLGGQAPAGGSSAPVGMPPMGGMPMMPQSPSGPPGGTPMGGATEQIVRHLDMVNSLLQDAIGSGQDIDPDVLGPSIQQFGQNLAILAQVHQGEQAASGAPPMASSENEGEY